MGHTRFLPPSAAGAKVLGVLFLSVVSVTVPNPYLLESQTRLTEMVALLGKCPELSSASLVVLILKGGLLLIPSSMCALSLSGSIRDGGTGPGAELKSSKIPNPYKGLQLFHILMSWTGLHFMDHINPKHFMAVPGP